MPKSTWFFILAIIFAIYAAYNIYQDYLINQDRIKINMKRIIRKNSRQYKKIQAINEWYDNNKINAKTNIIKTYKTDKINAYKSFNQTKEKLLLINDKQFIDNYYTPYKKNEKIYEEYLKKIHNINDPILSDEEIKKLIIGYKPKTTQEDIDSFSAYEQKLMTRVKPRPKPLEVTIVMNYDTEHTKKKQQFHLNIEEIDELVQTNGESARKQSIIDEESKNINRRTLPTNNNKKRKRKRRKENQS